MIGQRKAVRREAPDAELLQRLAAGEMSALGELYDRHQEGVRRFVMRATAGADDVDDLVHATFLAAARSACRYDGRTSCRPWLVGIALHHVQRRRRAFARFARLLSSIGLGKASVDPRPTLTVRTDIDRALAKISEAKRITFLLAEVEELTCPEIATALDVPIGTVWTRLHAARRELRALLEEGAE